MVLGRLVQGRGYEYETSKGAETISNLGRFLSFLSREQSHHLGNLDLCQHAACAVGWGMGEAGGNVWAAGFYHKAFSLRKAYSEFPRHDITQYFKGLVVQKYHIKKNMCPRYKRPITT